MFAGHPVSEQELQAVKAQIRAFDAGHTTREQCVQALQRVGIVDHNGQLAEPYRSAARPAKKK